MNIKGENLAQGNARRTVLKRLSAAAVVAAGMSEIPATWVRPVIDTVVLPAHAVTTTCIALMEQLSADIPQACSGGFFPAITIQLQVTTASSSIVISNVIASLPGQATMSGIVTGDVFNQGDLIYIKIDNYPSASQFACTATEPGSIEIEYNCQGYAGAPQTMSIDVLKTILAG